MDNATATTAEHGTAFDAAALVEKMLKLAAEEIAGHRKILGAVPPATVAALVEDHLRAPLETLAAGPLHCALADVDAELAEASRADAQLRTDPRYADAPSVTAVLHLKAWAGRYPVTLSSRQLTLPGAWLAAQDRDVLADTAEGIGDTDWIADDLQLLGDHDGDYELEIETGQLTAWLEATETTDEG